METERYHPLVAVDLLDACQHYDAIAIALGNRFRTSVQRKVRAIVERPEMFGRIAGDFRGASIERFPYVVVFTVDDGVTCIYGVRHAASDKESWFVRTMPEIDG